MIKKVILSATLMGTVLCANAQNPIISTMYTPDPAPFVYGDKVYLFVDHDEEPVRDSVPGQARAWSVTESGTGMYAATRPPAVTLWLLPWQTTPRDRGPMV